MTDDAGPAWPYLLKAIAAFALIVGIFVFIAYYPELAATYGWPVRR